MSKDGTGSSLRLLYGSAWSGEKREGVRERVRERSFKEKNIYLQFFRRMRKRNLRGTEKSISDGHRDDECVREEDVQYNDYRDSTPVLALSYPCKDTPKALWASFRPHRTTKTFAEMTWKKRRHYTE